MISPKMFTSNLLFLIFITFCASSTAKDCEQAKCRQQNILEMAKSTSQEILELRESLVGKEKLVLPLIDPADNDVIISSKYFPVFTLEGEFQIHLTEDGLINYLLLCLRNGHLPGYSWGLLAEIDSLTKIFTITTISSREGVDKLIEEAETVRVYKIGICGFFVAFRLNPMNKRFIGDFAAKFKTFNYFKNIQHEECNVIQICFMHHSLGPTQKLIGLKDRDFLFVRKIRTWKKMNDCFFWEPKYVIMKKIIRDVKIEANYFGYPYEEEFREVIEKLVLHCHVHIYEEFPFKFYNILSTNILRQGIDETYMEILRSDKKFERNRDAKCCCYDITMNPDYPDIAQNLCASVTQNPLNPAFFLQNVDNLLTAPPAWYSATLTGLPRSNPPFLDQIRANTYVRKQDLTESGKLIPDPIMISDIQPLTDLETQIYDYNGEYITSIHCPHMPSNPNRYTYMGSIFSDDMYTQLEFQV